MTTFEYEGNSYTLKLTRAGVREAEAQGLTTTALTTTPFSALGLLFFSALFHYKVNPNKANAMLDDLLDDGTFTFEELFEELAEAYGGLFGSGESEETTPTRSTMGTPSNDDTAL